MELIFKELPQREENFFYKIKGFQVLQTILLEKERHFNSKF
jgi:hypothetical protein